MVRAADTPVDQTLRARDTVRVDGLEVDRAPVTNARYAEFVASTGHRPPHYWSGGVLPALLSEHPVVGVDFFDAIAFAHWAGGSLPTEVEWVLATGLDEHRAFVWGDEFRANRANTLRSGVKGTSPVGAFPKGTAPSGCVDLCGNVWEMTCAPHPEGGETIVVKGGSWYDFPCHAKLDTSFRARIDRCGNTIGFRLVYGPPIRLPAFVQEEEAAACIARRRAGPAAEPATVATAVPTEERSGEREAVSTLLASDHCAVQEALRLFDHVDDESSAETAPEPALVRPAASEKRPSLYRRFPLLLPLASLLALSGVAFALLGLIDRHGSERTIAKPRPPPAGPVVRRSSPATRLTPRASAMRLFGGDTPLDRAMRDLLAGDSRDRDRAEAYLVTHPAGASLALARVTSNRLSTDAVASVRYVRAALEELEQGEGVEPLPIRRPPSTNGILLLFDEWDDDVARMTDQARWTGKAEGLPVTLVYTGSEDPRRLCSYYGDRMGAVAVFHDREREFAKRWEVQVQPSLALVDRTGKLRFLGSGELTRSKLAGSIRKLKG